MLALSLDMGGTHIGCGVVRDNQLLGSTSLDSEFAGSLESLLPCVTEALRTLLKESGAKTEEYDERSERAVFFHADCCTTKL